MDYSALSRIVSHALRHQPWIYELELDDEGWTCVTGLVASLRCICDDWSTLQVADLEAMVERSSKKRHEISGGRIRALYGHSVPGQLKRSPASPPDVLYHGTSKTAACEIAISGILPMGRQFVHLSTDILIARKVGMRKDRKPVLLRVDAGEAHKSGVTFYEGNDRVWLADAVPARFVQPIDGGPEPKGPGDSLL